MADKVRELKIGSYAVHSTHPLEPNDLRGIPCSLPALRAVLAKQLDAGKDIGRLQELLDAWNANPGLLLSDVIKKIEGE